MNIIELKLLAQHREGDTYDPAQDIGDDDDGDQEPDRTCQNCNGTGGDPWSDGCSPCPECDGEGFYYWK